VTLAVNRRDAATRILRVVGDPVMAISDADRKLLHETSLGLYEMLGLANQAADAVATLSEQLGTIEDLVAGADHPQAAVQTAIEDLTRRLVGLRRQLGVAAPTRRVASAVEGAVGGAGQVVRTPIGNLKSQVMNSTSSPTEAQLQAMRDSREALRKVLEETNWVITTGMPALYRTLGDHAVRPTLLKPLPSPPEPPGP
jgi:hypothetical protein